MITSEQLQQTQELLTNAIQYNLAMQEAFVSTDNYVQATLEYEGTKRTVTIPTYNYLVNTVTKLSRQVQQMQIADDGSNVLQLLSDTDSLRLLYLKRKQYYLAPPTNAKIVKYDYEQMHSINSASNGCCIVIDLTDCHLPLDVQHILAKLDNEEPMLLQIQSKATAFSKSCTVLTVQSTGVYLVDEHTLLQGQEVQINSNLYKVTYVNGNSIELESTELSAGTVMQGDVIYTTTDSSYPFIEVPIANLHTSLALQVQYMQLLSEAITIDLSDMGDAIHLTEQVAVKNVLSSKTIMSMARTASLAYRSIPSELSTILAASVPTVDRVTVRQVNSHQYVNSVVETMAKANATLTQAANDMTNIQASITVELEYLVSSGSSESANLMQLKADLASAKARYLAAQQTMNSLSISAQAVSPIYATTLYMSSVDSKELPIVQYVIRYQYLALSVQDYANEWMYAYSNKRTVDANGILRHDIDDYSTMNSIQLPIRAYEQIAYQVSAVVQYGQPFLNIQTPWSSVAFVSVPTTLLKEVSVDDMLKNLYEARLSSALDSAMQSAGVYKHIDLTSAFMHKATDILYSDSKSLYETIASMQQTINSILTKSSDSSGIEVYVVYNGTKYPVTQNAQIVLNAPSYYSKVLQGATTVSDKLGSIAEEDFSIMIVNNGVSVAILHSMFPGSPVDLVSNADYANIPIYDEDGATLQTYGLACYRSRNNAAANRQLVSSKPFLTDALDAPIRHNILEPAFTQTTADANAKQDRILFYNTANGGSTIYTADKDYDGIGIHDGFYDGTDTASHLIVNDQSSMALAARDFCESVPYNLLREPYVQAARLALFPPVLNAAMVQYYNYSLSKFPANIKHTSGKHTRGATMYLNPKSVNDIRLPIYGTSNAVSIESGVSNALIIPGKFQARMCDRLGLTDLANTVTKDVDGHVILSNTANNFNYTKTVNVNLQLGASVLSFDISMTMNMFD